MSLCLHCHGATWYKSYAPFPLRGLLSAVGLHPLQPLLGEIARISILNLHQHGTGPFQILLLHLLCAEFHGCIRISYSQANTVVRNLVGA